jgi:hypothetical protein
MPGESDAGGGVDRSEDSATSEGLPDEQVVKLLPALAEAGRADRRTAQRFVQPRTGVLEETASRRHQFVFGRRGVGKSTLLRKIESDRSGPDVIFVDIETLRGRPYPDVLIELLVDLLTTLDRRLRPTWYRLDRYAKRWRALTAVGSVSGALRHLLDSPQVAQRTVHELKSKKFGMGGGAGFDFKPHPVVRANASANGSIESEQKSARDATFEESKMDGLLAAAVPIRSALAEAHKHLGDDPTLIVLDDFYHIRFDDQPSVLAYLHQVVKNLDIYLKVCGVRHRLQPFVEGDPPLGMQLGHDASEISLDITLARFDTAKDFLEKILRGICEPLSIDITLLLTDGARTRLVLGSGGVARDYLTLTQTALRIANERRSSPSRPHNRITAEDVNEAATSLSQTKQEDLARDAGPNADALRARLTEVVRFCLDVTKTNVFLVEATELREQEWGKEIQALADLRFVHEIGYLSIRANDASNPFRGRRFVGFTLDLSNYTAIRSERDMKPIEFWTTEGKEKARAERLIYTPGAAERALRSPRAGTPKDDAIPDSEWVHVSTLEDYLESLPHQ